MKLDLSRLYPIMIDQKYPLVVSLVLYLNEYIKAKDEINNKPS
jgi:hypothetical protein